MHFAFCISSCSVPNLESPECSAARTAVREFYSNHFGGDMKFTPENLKAREKHLTPDLARLLQKFLTDSDPFTLSAPDDLPKAFRAGGCKVAAPDKTELQILLFWKDDVRSEQREITVEAVKQNETWLINNISSNTSNLQNLLNH
ncbi:MAG TPA: hypothetical protein VGB68_13895, partial [Pyrinomonadaceae bacterium]